MSVTRITGYSAACLTGQRTDDVPRSDWILPCSLYVVGAFSGLYVVGNIREGDAEGVVRLSLSYP